MGVAAWLVVEFGTGVSGGTGSLITLLWGFVFVAGVFGIYGLRREFRSLEGHA
jgi:hypothetical protein